MKTLITFLITFITTLLITPVIRKMAVKIGVMDYPAKRKIHKHTIPLFGGVAIYIGLLAGMLFGLKELYFILPIFLCSTMIFVIGLIDDIIGLSARFRLFCQILISLIIISSGVRVSFLPSSIWGNIGEVIITILWIVGVTNAYNYLDGMDGLATGSAVVNLFCFGVILYGTGQYCLYRLVVVLTGACLGFLPYNFRNARIFLGDAGSNFLGFSLACIAIAGSWAEDNIVKVTIPVLILGVPIFDMIFTTVMRIKERKIKDINGWLKYAGKDHFHHYLVDLGLRPTGAVLFILFVTLSLGISAIMVSNDIAFEALMSLSQASIIFGIIAVLIVVGKRHRSGWDNP